MEKLIQLLERLVVALETIAGKPSNIIPGNFAASESPAAEEGKPKGGRGRKAKAEPEPEPEPEVDYDALRNQAKDKVSELVDNGVKPAAIKKLIIKAGGDRVIAQDDDKGIPDENLQAFIDDLTALEDSSSDAL